MTYKLTDKKSIRLLSVLGWIIFFSCYITKINFSAVLVEFLQAENIMKSAAAPITTAFFITYGIGQLLSGYLGDRVSPRFLIFGGSVVAAVCNLMMPLVSPEIPLMALVWGINGVALSMIWPPLVKICANALTEEDYNRLIPLICTSGAAATIIIYLVSPLIIQLSNWKMVFAFTAGYALIASVIWIALTGKLLKNVSFAPAAKENTAVAKKANGRSLIWMLMPVIMCTIAVLGILKDGITTWMPTFMSENFQLESTVSILLGVVIPLSHMFLDLFVYRILVMMKRDVFAAIGLSFGVTAIFLLLLWICGGSSMILATAMIAIASGGLHTINALQTYYLPEVLGGTDNISFYAGLVNAVTYAGSAMSTYLFAIISEMHGWNTTIVSWMVFAATGFVLSFVCMAVLRRNGNAGRV